MDKRIAVVRRIRALLERLGFVDGVDSDGEVDVYQLPDADQAALLEEVVALHVLAGCRRSSATAKTTRALGTTSQLLRKVSALLRHTYGAELEVTEPGTTAKRANKKAPKVKVGRTWSIVFVKDPAPLLKEAGGFTRRPDTLPLQRVPMEWEFRNRSEPDAEDVPKSDPESDPESSRLSDTDDVQNN